MDLSLPSLYIHVPFCTKKCHYCHFYVIPNRPEFVDQYMVALKQEWEQKSHLLPACTSIYFGGGTPSLLGPDRIGEILSWLPTAHEITLEANPESIAHFPAVNRLSIGIQSFDNKQLIKLGRTHSANDALRAIEKSGVDNISIDLMYDLPNQTLNEWEETLHQAVALPIRHLSLYNLTIEPHTAFYKWKKRLALPPDELSLQLWERAIEIIGARFRRYELSAFAQPGYESLHNMGYWTGRSFLGLGPSAYSYWEGARFRNPPHFHRWRQNVMLQEDYDKLSPEASERELLALGLRLINGIKSPIDVDDLVMKGLIERQGAWVRLTALGQLFHDSVAAEIIAVD